MTNANTNNVIASYVICNTASMNIYDINEINDTVFAGINDDEPKEYSLFNDMESENEWGEVRVYFECCEIRYYLDEFMRNDAFFS